MLSDLIDRFDLKEEYPSIIQDAVSGLVPSRVITEDPLQVNDIGRNHSRSDSAEGRVLQEGRVLHITLTNVVKTNSSKFTQICKQFFDNDTHVVLQDVLCRDISFSDIFRAHHHDLLMVKSFPKVDCDSDLSSLPDSYFMTSIEYAKFLLFFGYITYSDFRRVSHYGLTQLPIILGFVQRSNKSPFISQDLFPRICLEICFFFLRYVWRFDKSPKHISGFFSKSVVEQVDTGIHTH